MRLPDALTLRRDLARRNPHLLYVVRRSGKRSLGVSPFYVAVDREALNRRRRAAAR